MNVDLTPDQRALVKRAIESGRFSHEEEAVQEALGAVGRTGAQEAGDPRGPRRGRGVTREGRRPSDYGRIDEGARGGNQGARAQAAGGGTHCSALMDFRVAPQAESDLDEIWYFLATQSSSIGVADRVVDSITARFVLLARQPYIGRRRDEDLRPGVRTFPVGDYVIAYRVDGDDVLILRVLRGSRDIEALFRE